MLRPSPVRERVDAQRQGEQNALERRVKRTSEGRKQVERDDMEAKDVERMLPQQH